MSKKNKKFQPHANYTKALLSREDLANPHRHIPHEERLKMSGAIDLRDNHTIIHLPNGKIRVVPIDPSKKYGQEP